MYKVVNFGGESLNLSDKELKKSVEFNKQLCDSWVKGDFNSVITLDDKKGNFKVAFPGMKVNKVFYELDTLLGYIEDNFICSVEGVKEWYSIVCRNNVLTIRCNLGNIFGVSLINLRVFVNSKSFKFLGEDIEELRFLFSKFMAELPLPDGNPNVNEYPNSMLVIYPKDDSHFSPFYLKNKLGYYIGFREDKFDSTMLDNEDFKVFDGGQDDPGRYITVLLV